jgi:hypothetical protein
MTNDPGANERIDPTPVMDPLHLHQRSGFGLNAISKKDPGNVINPGSNNYYNYTSSTLWPPAIVIPPFIPPAPPGDLIPGPAPDPEDPGVPPVAPDPGAFVYYNGAWWAAVELDLNTGLFTTPYWTQFAPAIGGGDSGANLRFNTTNGNVEYWDGSSWVSWADLPTSDPGGGAIWLSAT